MINDTITAKATLQLGDPDNDFSVLQFGVQISASKTKHLKKLYSSLSGKMVDANQLWIRIEATTKEEFQEFTKAHEDFLGRMGESLQVYDFSSGIIVCVDITRLLEQNHMPEHLNPSLHSEIIGEGYEGESFIKLRLSSGIGLKQALDCQLNEGVIFLATFLENLTGNFDIQFQKSTFNSIMEKFEEPASGLLRQFFGDKEFRNLVMSMFQYLDSIQLNFKLASWRMLPAVVQKKIPRGHDLKDVIKEILQRKVINRVFKFFGNLTENSFTVQVFLNDSIYLEGHVITPGFLDYISTEIVEEE